MAPQKERRINRYTCEEAFSRLDDYLDRELTEEEMQRVQAHMQVCAFCAAEFAFEADVLDGVRAKLRRISAPPDLLERVRRALAQPSDDGEKRR
jgi:anti-sigma factor (TIGR02949 family)